MADNTDVSDAGSGRRPWQGRADDATAGVPRSRRPVGLFLLVGLFLALASVIIVWLLLIRKPSATPYFVTITIGDYNSRHYPNLPFAASDSELLLRHFAADAKKQAVTKSKRLLREQLKALEEQSKRPLIVHLAAFALVRGDAVYLLPGDADPDDDSTWLDVREVIEAVKQSPAPQKLLILDVAHPLADARLGVLADRVARTLEENLKKDEPPFHVLLPCASGQFSYSSEAMQASAWAYYFDQGLQGQADVKKVGHVTLHDLIDFMKPRVDRWARNNLAVRQELRLLGKGSDFAIAHLSERTPGPLAPPKLDVFPDSLKKGWKVRDDAWDVGAFQRAPRQLLKLQANLLRLEERWRSGLAPVKNLDDETQNLANDLTAALVVLRPPYRSLAMAGVSADPKLVETLYQGLLMDADPKKSAEEHAKKVTDELLKKVTEDKKLTFPQQAAALLDAFDRVKQVQPLHIQTVDTALLKLRAKPSYIEVLTAQRLAEFARDQYPEWPPEKVKLLWQTAREQQAVLALLEREPEFLPWFAGDIDEADKLRRAGERNLFRDRPSTWNDAVKKLTPAKQAYEQVEKNIDMMHKARYELDRAFALLPIYARHLCDWPEDDFAFERSWFTAAEESRTLQEFFAHPPATSKRPDAKVSVHTRKLKDSLDELDEAFDLRIRAAEKDASARGQRQLRSLLASSLLKAGKRGELADKQRTLAVKLHEANDKLDQDSASPRPTDVGPALAERNAAALRAKMSAALVRLTGDADAQRKLDLPLEQAQWSERDVAAAEPILHTIWGKDLLERWRSAKPTPDADALNRLISPWDWHSRVADSNRDASLLLRRDLRKSYLQWLAASYQAEARSLETNKYDRAASEFFADAAEKLRLSISGSD